MDIVGVWGYEAIVGPTLRGQISVTSKGPLWYASISGVRAKAKVNGTQDKKDGRLEFAFGEDGGEFRGQVSENGREIVGHWIQPRSITNNSVYATPIRLQVAGNNEWRGEIVPLDDRIELYLVIEHGPDSTQRAFMRDRERNSGVWLRLGAVSSEGSEVHIASQQGELTGKYNEEGDTLSLTLPDYPVALDFTRRGRNEAKGFYPRTPPVEHYSYQAPATYNDGWQTASLTEAGLRPEPVVALVEQILRTETTGLTTPYIHGLLIARAGKLLLEEYFYGYDKDSPHDMRSASKSLVSPLVGIALEEGAHFNLNTPVYSLFPEYSSFENEDARKSDITVEHLLTMSSGLACDDNDDDSPGNEDTMQDQEMQPDWYKYALDLPVVQEPGKAGVYCSAGINLLGGVISNSTGMWLSDFIYEHLALPLDFGRYYLKLMPGKNTYMGGGVYIRPRDFMKLGELFLRGGRWNGRQIVSNEWVDASWQAHSQLQDHDYGYGWHLGEYYVNGQRYRRVEAGGNGGQLVIIIPDLDIVVMFTGGNYSDFRTWSKFRDQLVPEFIIPAIL